MAESVNGIRVSKSFGIETESLEEFKKTNQKHYRAGFRQNFAMNAFFPTIEFVSVMGTIIVLLIGGQSTILALGLTTGTMYLFVSLLGRFFFPVTQLVNFYAQIQAGFAGYERILQVIDAEPEVKDEGNIKQDKIEGKIEFMESLGVLSTGIYVPLAAVFPYLLSFYLVLGILEDIGYLPRLSVLMDNLMHKSTKGYS